MPRRAALTVTSTRNWTWTREYNVQLSRESRDEYFPDTSHGDFLLLEARHDGVTFAVFGKVDLVGTGHLGPSEVGIGNNLRHALGVDLGEEVDVSDRTPPRDWRRRVDQLLGKRPVLCRVRTAVHPDIGFDVCRVSEATMDSLGVAPGDHVVIESTRGLRSLKALPLREEVADRKRRETRQNPERYPDPATVLGLERFDGTDVDLPEIYLDAERRSDLELPAQTEADGPPLLATGACQPVKVSRNSTSVYVRSLNEVTVPVIVGLLATVFVFEPWLSLADRVAIIGLGIVFILLSITYRVRKTTLG